MRILSKILLIRLSLLKKIKYDSTCSRVERFNASPRLVDYIINGSTIVKLLMSSVKISYLSVDKTVIEHSYLRALFSFDVFICWLSASY